MGHGRDVWDLLDAIDHVVDLAASEDRVRDFILRVCRMIVGTEDGQLRALLAVGEACSPGAGAKREIVAARMTAHTLMDQLRHDPRQEARVRCIRYALPDKNKYDPYEALSHFLDDAKTAGVSDSDLGAIMVGVFPEALSG